MKTNYIILLLTLTLFSCKSLRNENYEAIRVFLETEKTDKSKKYILQKEQISSKNVLRIFNGDKGAEHIMDPLDPTDYTKGLFKDKHWRKLYKRHYWLLGKRRFSRIQFCFRKYKIHFYSKFLLYLFS